MNDLVYIVFLMGYSTWDGDEFMGAYASHEDAIVALSKEKYPSDFIVREYRLNSGFNQ